jgi:hypothetical protein
MACGPGHVLPEWGGPYVFWTSEDLINAIKKIDQAIQNSAPGVGTLTSASINGKTFTFQTGSGVSDPLAQLASQKSELVKLYQLTTTGTYNGPTNRAVGVMRMPYYGTPNPCCG